MSRGTDIIYLEGEREKKKEPQGYFRLARGGGVAKFLYRILGGLAS